jgi:sugar-specific transcriptional regulator TrmB
LNSRYATTEEFDVLIRLGLTLNEVRVLIALYASESLTAKAIAKSSGVAREIVYQIVPKLQKKGLVDELITNPKTFKALPLENTIDLLLQQRKNEDNELFSKAQAMAKKQQKITKVKNEESYTTLTAPKKEDPNWKKDWANYKTDVDLIMLTDKFLQWPKHTAEQNIDNAILRKTKMHMITQTATKDIIAHPPAEHFSESLISKLKVIDYRYVDAVPVEMVIFDKKILYLSTSNEENISDMVWLRSNNGFLVEMANNYFETLWSASNSQKENKNVKSPFSTRDFQLY